MALINLKNKVIPIGSGVEIVLKSGIPPSKYSATVEPDDGYKIKLGSLKLIIPAGVYANVILKTEDNEMPLFKDNMTDITYEAPQSLLDSIDYVDMLILYVEVPDALTEDKSVVLEIAGSQTIPYVG